MNLTVSSKRCIFSLLVEKISSTSKSQNSASNRALSLWSDRNAGVNEYTFPNVPASASK